MRPSVGCVVLTRGGRPDELARALASLLRQRDVDADVVVVGNGWKPSGLPEGVRELWLPENVGIAAGRNAGVPHVSGDWVVFLDDDAQLASDDALARAVRLLESEPDIGLLQLRVRDPDGRPPSRTWVPRLRVGDPARSSDVTAVWEGAIVMRRRAWEEIGGWSEVFVYGHEGVDLAWRVMDAGYRVHYTGEIEALHVAHPPARHSFSHFMTARHRVWLARRNLPFPFAVLYPAAWLAVSLVRLRSLGAARDVLRGYRAGLREPCGERRPLRWRTLWRMTRAGRPPVL